METEMQTTAQSGISKQNKKTSKTSATTKANAQPQKRNTVFKDDFSKEVFDLTYRFGNETDVNDRHLAVAKDLASIEKPELQDYWTNKFLDLLEDFKFVPGGRITSNAGTSLKGTT